METKTYTEEEIMINDKVRNDIMGKFINEVGGIGANKIWTELGTKFEPINGKFMDVDLTSAYFDKKNKEAVRDYTKENGSKKEYYSELVEAGMCKVKFKEYNEENYRIILEVVKGTNSSDYNDLTKGVINTFRQPVVNTEVKLGSSDCNDLTKAIDNRFRQSIENTITLENVEYVETTRSYKLIKFKECTEPVMFKNNGTWLFSLEAVCKLGMFMTGTEKAKEFRNLIIRSLEEQPVLEQQLGKLAEDSFEGLLQCFQQDKIPVLTNFHSYIDSLVVSLIMSRKDLYDSIDKLTEMKNEITKCLNTRNKKMMETIDYDDLLEDEVMILNRYLKKVSNKIIEIMKKIDEYKEKVLQSIGTEVKTNFTDIIAKRIGEEPTKKEINEVKNKLVVAGILEIHKYDKYEFVTKENEDGTLTKEKVLKRNNKNEIVQGSNYLPVKNFEWINTAKIGMFSNDKRAQIIKFSEYGSELINYILDEIEAGNDVSSLTQEKFEDHLVAIN